MWTCIGVRVPKTLDYPTLILNPRMITTHFHLRQTDKRTNIMAIARRVVLRTHHVVKSSIHFGTDTLNMAIICDIPMDHAYMQYVGSKQ